MALKARDFGNGTFVMDNCFHNVEDSKYLAADGEFSVVGHFCIGVDRRSTPIQANIFFDPADIDDFEEEDEIGLYNLVSLTLNGVPFPPSLINPNLAYLDQLGEPINGKMFWPQVIDSFHVQNSRLNDNQFVFPFYSLNGVALNGNVDVYKTSQSIPIQHCGYNAIVKSTFEEGDSLMASASIPIGIDYNGLSFQILEAIMDIDWEDAEPDFHFEVSREIWDDMSIQDCILKAMEMDISEVDEIMVFDQRALFKITDEELYHIFLYAYPDITDESVFCYVYKLDADKLNKIERGQIINFFYNFKAFMKAIGLEQEGPGETEAFERGDTGLDNGEKILSQMNNCQLTMECCTIACSLRRMEDNYLTPLGGIDWMASRVFDFDTLSFGESAFEGPIPISTEQLLSLPGVPCFDKYVEYIEKVGTEVSGHEMWFFRD